MNHTSPKTHLTLFIMNWTWIQQAFDIFSQLFAFSCFSLFFPLNRYILSTNQIQREFLFNDAIASQNLVPASSPLRQKTNLLKLGVLVTCAVKRRTAVKAPLSIVSLRTSWRGAGGEVCAAEREACCHFAPPRATCVTLRRQEGKAGVSGCFCP
jgi:hypothetical protein